MRECVCEEGLGAPPEELKIAEDARPAQSLPFGLGAAPVLPEMGTSNLILRCKVDSPAHSPPRCLSCTPGLESVLTQGLFRILVNGRAATAITPPPPMFFVP